MNRLPIAVFFVVIAGAGGAALGYFLRDKAADETQRSLADVIAQRDKYKQQLQEVIGDYSVERTRSAESAQLASEAEQRVATLQQERQLLSDQFALTTRQHGELHKFWTYRSPILTHALQQFAEAIHTMEDTYPEDDAVLLKAETTFHEALNQWREEAEEAKAKATNPHEAMRVMAEATRKYEAGEITDAEYTEAQKRFLESMKKSTARE